MRGQRALGYILRNHWAMTEEALRTVITIAQRETSSPEAIAAATGERLDNTRQVTLRDGVATIPIRGPLFRYANLFTSVSGATSMEILANDLMEAATSPEVRAILLDIDSPGGEVNGTQELGELIFEGRELKPLVAHISGDGNSAAYWLASAASEIVVGPTSIAGSIGVRAAFLDTSEADRMAGLREIVIVSSQSPRKDVDPTTPDGVHDIQVVLDDLAEVFVTTVARNRGVDPETVLRDFGQGGVFVGARAVTAGLTDRILTFEALHAELAQRVSPGRNRIALPRPGATSPLPQQEQIMPTPEKAISTDPLSAETIAEQYPAFVAAWRNEGGVAERTRLFAIDALAKPGLEKVLAGCREDPTCSAGDAALRIIEHEEAQGRLRLEARLSEEGDGDLPTAAPASPDTDSPAQMATRRLLSTLSTIQSETSATGRNA